MAYYDDFVSRSTSPSPTTYKADLQAKSTESFQYASDYYTVKHKDRVTGVYNDLGVRLAKPSKSRYVGSLVDDMFEVMFQDFNQTVYLGDLFEFDDYRWMVVDTSNLRSITTSVVIQRCNVQLKFVASTPSVNPTVTSTIYTVDGIASTKLYVIEEDKYVLLPINQMSILIPNDTDGKRIKYTNQSGTRFLFGNPYQAWRTIGIDSNTRVRRTIAATPTDYNGIISLRLQSDNINSSLDNVTLGIAKQYV